MNLWCVSLKYRTGSCKLTPWFSDNIYVKPPRLKNIEIHRKVTPIRVSHPLPQIHPFQLIKPPGAIYTSKYGILFFQLAQEAGFPAGVINVVTSSRQNAAEIGKEFCENPNVGKISFTGSTATGKVRYSISGIVNYRFLSC